MFDQGYKGSQDVQSFYEKCSASVGSAKKWNELTAQEQYAIVEALNLIISVVYSGAQR